MSKKLFLAIMFVGFVLALVVERVFSQETGQPDYLVSITASSPRDRVFENSDSGALVDPQYVLTCSHNIGPAHTSITVRFENGDEVEAEVAFRNRFLDLAILKLGEVRYEKPVEIHDDSVNGGQTVTVWGFSDIGAEQVTGEVFNLISPIRRVQFRFRGQVGKGFSGGPVLLDGKLVGVATGSFPGTGIRCTNTPYVRNFLENIPND